MNRLEGLKPLHKKKPYPSEGTSTIWRNVATTALALSTQQEQLDRQRGLINAMHVLEPSKEPEKEDEHHGLNTK